MTSTPARSRTLLRVAGTPILLAAVLLGLAAPASAHDQLISSSPDDGEVLTTAPDTLMLTYSAETQTLGADVRVIGPDGTESREGDLAIQGTQLEVPLRADLGSGAYQVAWRVTSSDGHPIDGTFTYTLDVPAPSPTTESPTAESPTASSPVTTPAPTESSRPEPTQSDSQSASATSEQESAQAQDSATSRSTSPVVWVVAGMAVLIAAGAAALLLRNRRRRT